MKRHSKAQSILEYTVILAAIVGAIIVGSKVIGTKVKDSFTDAGTVIDNASGDFANLYETTSE